VSVEAEAHMGEARKPRSTLRLPDRPAAEPQRLSPPTFSTASVKDILSGRIEVTPTKEPPPSSSGLLGGVATLVSLIAALFIGFLQLPGWLLIPLAALSVYGMHSYHPAEFRSWRSYLWPLIGACLILSLAAWLALLASLYMSGHSFVQSG
jgi:hypothetical protein